MAARLPAPPQRRGQDHPGLQPHAPGRSSRPPTTSSSSTTASSFARARWPNSPEVGARSSRSSDLDSLAGALRIADVESAPGPDDTLIAETTDLRLVGDVALRAGLPIWELKAKQADLEELFFSLTEGTNRNLGDATYPDSAAPTERDALAGQEGANL